MPASYIDFSVNINPLGMPRSIQDNWTSWLSLAADYPDPEARELKQLLASCNGIGESMILPGNGAAELIMLIAQRLRGRTVLIAEPAFPEYEAACQSQGCSIRRHLLDERTWNLDADRLLSDAEGASAVFLCSPANPTGTRYTSCEVEKIAAACLERNCLLIVDEAFYDFAEPPETVLPLVKKYPNLLILRSLTKMYAIAGLRLGYAAGNAELIHSLQQTRPHWSVNAIAMQAGKECLLDGAHARHTRRFIGKERERLFDFYREEGFRFSDSKVNFYLLQPPDEQDTEQLLYHMLERGIVPRHTYNFPGLEGRWLRIAVKTESENNRLREVLAGWNRNRSSL